MRITSFVLAMMLLTSLVRAQATTQPSAPAAPMENEEGKQLVQKIIAAHGGAEAFAKIKTMRVKIESTLTSANGEQIRKSHTISTYRYPDRGRYEASVEQSGGEASRTGTSKSATSVSAFVGEQGWAITTGAGVPSMAVQTLPPQTIAQYRKSIAGSMLRVLQGAKSGEYHFAAAGTDKIGDVEGAALEVSGPNGTNFRWIVDGKTGNLLGRVDPTARTTYLAFETVDGVKVSSHTKSTNSRGDVTDLTSKYELNPTIDDHAFDKPADPTPGTTQPSGEGK